MATNVLPQTPADLPREVGIRFIAPLPGLEGHAAYTLIGIEGVPVYWLRCDDAPGIRLPVAEAFAIEPSYSFTLSTADVIALGLEHPEDALVLVVLTIRHGGTITANLFAPIVVNRRLWRAKQVILDGTSYSLRQPVEGFA
jgi:flagellar assembly factor FliW